MRDFCVRRILLGCDYCDFLWITVKGGLICRKGKDVKTRILGKGD